MKRVSKKTTSVGCGLSTPVFLKSKYCGFCSGVKRAIRIASQAAKNNCAVYTLGDIIHNHQVVEKLKKNNIISISSTSSLKNATLIIPSHGIPLRKESEFKKQGFEVIDATCPKVKRAQKILENLAEEFSIVFIVGLKTHPEVKGILSRSKGKGRVISSIREAAKISPFDNAGVIAQTTFREEKFFKIVNELLKKARVLKIYNTICEETISRQKELKKIAASVDFLFVVGGKNSSNTKRLYEVGRRLTDTHHIETPDDINWTLLNGKKKIGIVTGASTPLNIVKKIEKKIIKRGK